MVKLGTMMSANKLFKLIFLALLLAMLPAAVYAQDVRLLDPSDRWGDGGRGDRGQRDGRGTEL